MVLKGDGVDEGWTLVTAINWRDGGVSRLWWGRSGMRQQVLETSIQLDDRRTTKLTLDAAWVRADRLTWALYLSSRECDWIDDLVGPRSKQSPPDMEASQAGLRRWWQSGGR